MIVVRRRPPCPDLCLAMAWGRTPAQGVGSGEGPFAEVCIRPRPIRGRRLGRWNFRRADLRADVRLILPSRMEIRWTNHATERLRGWRESRGVTSGDVEEILREPEQVVPGDQEARVAQSRYEDGLLRVVFVEEADERRVLTVYWTSQVERYWRGG